MQISTLLRRTVPALALGLALSGGVASLALAQTSGVPPQVAAMTDGQANSVRHEQLLNQPDPNINVPESSRLRDGADEVVNPATGTPLPWTVQPD